MDAGAFFVFGEIAQPNLPEFYGIGAGQGGFDVGQDLFGPAGGVLGPFQRNALGFIGVKVNIREGAEEEIIVGTAIVNGALSDFTLEVTDPAPIWAL